MQRSEAGVRLGYLKKGGMPEVGAQEDGGKR